VQLRRIFYTLARLHANPGLSRVLRRNPFTATYGGSLSNIDVGVQHFGTPSFDQRDLRGAAGTVAFRPTTGPSPHPRRVPGGGHR
jgi:hypothetical protein